MFIEKEEPKYWTPKYYWRSNTKSKTGYSICEYPPNREDRMLVNNFVRFLTDHEVQENINNLPQSFYEKQEE